MSSSERPAETHLSSGNGLACKGRRSTEEEKLARRLARQQRNRKSAQVSREKKKAYMDQIEQELVTLRADKQASMQREREAAAKCAQLESRVEELSARLSQFESVFANLVKSQSNATDAGSLGVNAGNSESPDVKRMFNGDDVSVSYSDVAQATAAPAAVLTTAGPLSPMLREGSDSTCLPAVKTTGYSDENGLALQRVQSAHVPLSAMMTRPLPVRQQMQQPTAAALLPNAHSRRTLHSSRGTSALTPSLPVLPHFPLSTADVATRCTRQSTQHGARLSMSRMLRLRLKIPRHRLNAVLRRYALAPVT